ncbi:MAG: hypothetical protein JWO15_1867 [Sphingomonadales bacterium]|nr:hypothetical protein [Sphingomonadales bacterium]
MKRALLAATRWADEIADRSGAMGNVVIVDPLAVFDRSDAVSLGKPGLRSANGSARMVRVADGWLALNLARESDVELMPAWLNGRKAVDQRADDLVGQAQLLGLPVARIGEAAPASGIVRRMGAGGLDSAGRQLRVVDLSSLWAGPLCGSVFAAMGAEVVKVESIARPDTTATSAPALDVRLNGRKKRVALDLRGPELRDLLDNADVIITSARRRAFEQLELAPEMLFVRNPALIWVAISGYGWSGAHANRVAFGDDAAAAGGLVRWTAGGAPRFIGDALADPLTGLAAAAAALDAVRRGGGFFIDAAMAGIAASAAA